VLFVLSSIGLPGLNGFPSEFLTILGAFKSNYLGMGFGVVAAIGIILGALYMLHMTARVIFGPPKTPGHGDESATGGHGETAKGQDEKHGELPRDLSGREIGVLIPIAIAVVVIGVIPATLLNTFRGPVRQLIGEDAAVVRVEEPRRTQAPQVSVATEAR
jgi:NADH-quinone oxidoreductase subunit M